MLLLGNHTPHWVSPNAMPLYSNRTRFARENKTPARGRGLLFALCVELTLAELGRTTRLAHTIVFTFDNTAVACQEARSL